MSNALTGQFDAVLQVSAGTVQRLLAGLHRNDRTNPSVPTLPHVIGLHVDVGDTHGHVSAQVGVPIISLKDGSTDTFHLDVGIRARYVPDEGSNPLPQFIHGTIGADYVMERVDPSCSGWEHAAADHVWLRVVNGSVTFRGTTSEQVDPWSIVFDTDTPEVHARIRSIVELLLKTQFEATPHRVASGFQPGHLVQLVRDGGAAVAIPVGLDGGVPPGSPTSIGQVFLGERDVALGVSREVVLGRVQQVLDDFRQSFGQTIQLKFTAGAFGWDIVKVDITWGVRVTSATATWVGPVSLWGGVDIDVQVHGGGSTQKAQYNWTFDVAQRIHLTVDAGTGWVRATPVGGPSVGIHYDGPYADEAKAAALPQVEATLKAQIQALTGNVGADLGLSGRADDISRQLQTLDPAAFARFDSTRYVDDGIVILGTIWMSVPDSGAQIKMKKRPEGDGYTAMDSWVPGGRIDRYHWSWKWADGSRPAGDEEHKDRWILRRPHGGGYGPFGVPAQLEGELPGLDGAGSVRLDLSGIYIDDVTGEIVKFAVSTEPINVTLPVGIIPRERLTISTNDIHGPIPGEHTPVTIAGLTVDVGGGWATTAGSNILVVRPGEGVTDEALVSTMTAGLAGATKEGAGLQILVLHPEGRLDAAGVQASAQRFHAGVGAHAATYVSLDVDGTWTQELDLPTDLSTTVMALVTPAGGLSWMQDGELDGSTLSEALDTYLVPASRPTYDIVGLGVDRSDLLGPWALAASGAGCPAPPIGRLGRRAAITFVRPGSATNGRTLATLKRLAPDPEEVFTAVVVHGPASDGTEIRAAGLGGDAVPIVDPTGEIAARFGIRTWPTTVLIDEDGTVVRVIAGPGDDPAGALATGRTIGSDLEVEA